MDILSMLTSSPIFSGYSNFMNNFGSALGANFATYPFQKKMAKRQYEYQQALQDDAQAHQIYMYQNQNQWRVNDLRSAGLNPILATHAGSSMPSASAGSVGLGSPSHGSTSALNLEHFVRLFNNRYKKENDLLDAQIASAKSVADSNKGLAAKYVAEANNINLSSSYEFNPEVINLKKRQLKFNSTGRFGKEFGIVDEVTPVSFDPNSAIGQKIEQDNFKRKQFNKIFPNEMRKHYYKSFPFLFK